MIMHFEDGPSVTVEVGTSHFISAPRWFVSGDRGALIIPNWDCNGRIVRAKEHEVRWEEEIIYTKAGPTKTMAPRAKDTIENISLTAACGMPITTCSTGTWPIILTVLPSSLSSPKNNAGDEDYGGGV